MPDKFVDHEVLVAFARDKVNVPADEAADRRRQVGHLRTRLESYIGAHPSYDLVKMRAAGSTAKHTATRRRPGRGSDADLAAYVRATGVGGIACDERDLLDWLRERCIEVYGATKDAKDFVVSEHAVGITLHGSGLKIDVVPVLYEGAPDDQGYLVTRQGDRVLTSVTQHITFIQTRRNKVGPAYRELIRLLKAWIAQAKHEDDQLRCKSFMIELIVAHLCDNGWHGEPLALDDYPRAFEQVLAYVVSTELRVPIVFTDFYPTTAVKATTDPIQIWDPVNPANNVARSYTELHRQRLVKTAQIALENVAWATQSHTKGDANDAWRSLFGPGFQGA